jgi:hypothetical protein
VRVCVSVRWVCVSLAHSHSLSLSVRRSICVYAFVQTVGLSLSLSLYLSVCLGLVHVCMRVCVSCVCVSLSDPPPTPPAPPPPPLLSCPLLFLDTGQAWPRTVVRREDLPGRAYDVPAGDHDTACVSLPGICLPASLLAFSSSFSLVSASR